MWMTCSVTAPLAGGFATALVGAAATTATLALLGAMMRGGGGGCGRT